MGSSRFFGVRGRNLGRWCSALTAVLLASSAWGQPTAIYWVDTASPAKIQRSNIDGTGVTTVVPNLGALFGLDLDVAGGKMYWADASTQKIQRANLDGSNIEDMITGTGGNRGIVLNPAGSLMFYTGDQTIRRANLDGTGTTTIVSGLTGGPHDMAIDVAGGKIYWTRSDNDVRRSNFDGSNLQTLVSGLGNPLGIALNVAAGHVYFTEISNNRISRRNMDGSGSTSIIISGGNASSVTGISLDVDGSRMYFASLGNGTIVRANLDGTGQQVLVSGLGTLFDVKLLVSVATQACCRLDGTCSDLPPGNCTGQGGTPQGSGSDCASLSDADGDGAPDPCDLCPADPNKSAPGDCGCGNPETDSDGDGVADCIDACPGYDDTIDCNTNGTPDGCDILGGDSADCDANNVPDECAGGGTNATKMYWCDTDNGQIRRANLDGTNIETLVSGLGALFGIDVDSVGGKVYWPDASSQKIQRANLDGTSVQDVITGTGGNRGIVLDVTRSQFFYTGDSTIRRANLDGSGVTTIVTGLSGGPHAMAIDAGAAKVYWTRSNNDVRRSNLDGSNMETLVSGLGNPLGLALDAAGGKIYYSDLSGNTVNRANLNGSLPQTLITAPNATNAAGIALDLPNGVMYYLYHNEPKGIRRANLDGTNVVDIITGMGRAYGIALQQAPSAQACCLCDGHCADLSTATCTNLGGTPQGNGTTCGSMSDSDGDSYPDYCDGCPADPDKREPGQCGCGNPETDTDGDGFADCIDACPGFDDGLDCNTNSVPDGCDIGTSFSEDCNGNGTPDECEGGGILTWIGGDGASFADGSNWSSGNVPGSAGQIVLSNPTGTDNRCVLGGLAGASVCGATIEATGGARQVLQIDAGSVFSTDNGISILTGGDINLQGGEVLGGIITNTSNTVSGYGRIGAPVENLGRLAGDYGENLRIAGASLTNQSTGQIDALAASILLLQSPSITQSGVIEIQTLGGVITSTLLTNSAGGQITLLGGSLVCPGLTNDVAAEISGFGTIHGDTANDGDIVTFADFQIVGNLNNEGTVTVQSGLLTITGNLSGGGSIIGGFGGRDGSAGLRLAGDFDLALTDPGAFDMAAAVLQLDSDDPRRVQHMEALAADVGARGVLLPSAQLYSIGTLRIGPNPTSVKLVDRRVNSRGRGAEAFYCDRLELSAGVTLDLAGLHLYCGAMVPSPDELNARGIRVTDSIGGGGLVQLGSRPGKASGAGPR